MLWALVLLWCDDCPSASEDALNQHVDVDSLFQLSNRGTQKIEFYQVGFDGHIQLSKMRVVRIRQSRCHDQWTRVDGFQVHLEGMDNFEHASGGSVG